MTKYYMHLFTPYSSISVEYDVERLCNYVGMTPREKMLYKRVWETASTYTDLTQFVDELNRLIKSCLFVVKDIERDGDCVNGTLYIIKRTWKVKLLHLFKRI